MNERIDELMIEAGARFEFLHSVHYDDFQYKKFAELIVQECIHQVLTGIKCNPPQAEPPEIAKTLARRLQQHFGVKE